MPVHHVISRVTLLLLGLWASGGIFAVSFVASRWAKHHGHRHSHALHVDERAHVRSASPISFYHPAQERLVSVVIPTHNRADIIGRAIESALSQTYAELEVVVADDGSSDNTREVAESYGSRVRYARQANAGVSAARNFGMRHARGEFIAFLDSDDAWQPWKVEAEVEALRHYPEAGVAWTDMTAVDESSNVLSERYLRRMYSVYQDIDVPALLTMVGSVADFSASAPASIAGAPVYRGDVSSAILLGNLIHTSTALFRRAWCELSGGFDQTYERAGEDYEFYIRLTSVGPAVFLDAPSALYRIGVADQLTAPGMMLEIARNNLRAIKTWLPPSDNPDALPQRVVKRRFSESYAWLGEAELEAGHRSRAARQLTKSLAIRPAFDTRALLLASCVLPSRLRQRVQLVRHSVAKLGFRHSHSSA